MILSLHIKNIGIIEDLSVDLNNGLNVLTGETGAGKTLIIDSLQIISGGRFSKEMIRKGETNSFVELCMYNPESEYAVDGNIIVSREININGKNMCKINGRMVTVNELKEFMMNFIEIHGQNDNQTILDTKSHIKYLDGFIFNELREKKEEYVKLYDRYIEIKNELKMNYGDDKERQRKLDLLKYQMDEIEEANLKIHEEEELEEKRKIFLNSEKISENLIEADTLLSENTIDSLSMVIRALEKIENIDKKYEKASTELKNSYYELQELARDINNYKEDIYFDEEERNYVEERLDLIYSLKRKYGNDIPEILKYKEDIKEEINHIENLDIYNQKLKNELNIVKEKLNQLGRKISNIRKKGADKLSTKINNELEDLEMKNAKINVKVQYMEEEFYKNGKDIVKFYITTNLGEDEKELSKIASGGEMSRTMLAIKKVLADTDNMPILIFDEIDTGISGKAANSVANKLKAISKKHQVICISHLPNIAANADYNYFISKDVNGDRTKTKIKQLEEEEIIKEIARISSGEINEITLKYAYELRNKKNNEAA
ncbi:MAG: DNA repair protein RecN [Clostridia bacterium]